MENQEVDQKIQRIIQSNDFDDLFKALSLKSESTVKAICFMLAKLAYWRELRLKRSVAPKDLTFLSRIAHFHMVNKIQIKATGRSKLLPKEISCDKAQEYFIDEMTCQEIFDRHGRKISISDEAIDCIYKDEMTGRHTIDNQYYRLYRARRLPWIIPTLKDSKEIYFLDKPKFGCRDFFYIAEFSIPYEDLNEENQHIEKSHLSYFVVLARRKYRMQTLEFITAYSMFDYFDLLQYMERWQLFEGEIKRPGG